MTTTPQPPPDICRGPLVKTEAPNLTCAWCKRESPHHATRINEERALRCELEWPDRPHGVVRAQFREAMITETGFQCWKCGLPTLWDSKFQTDFVRAIADGVEVKAICVRCGSGLDIEKAVILGGEEVAKVMLNQGMNRQQRRANVAGKKAGR